MPGCVLINGRWILFSHERINYCIGRAWRPHALLVVGGGAGLSWYLTPSRIARGWGGACLSFTYVLSIGEAVNS